MPKGIVVRAAFGHLRVIVSLEGRVVFHNVVRCVNQCIPENPGTTLRHSGVAGIEVSRLIYRRIWSGKREQLTGLLEAMGVANLAQDHSAIDISDAGNGHNNGIEPKHDIRHLGFDIFDLPVR